MCRSLIMNNLEGIYSLIMVENNNQSRIKEIGSKYQTTIEHLLHINPGV